MLFNSIEFLFVFLPITYLVFWALSTARARYVWLALTGYVFYGYWNPWFSLLMVFSTLVSYTAGLGMLRWDDTRRRKLCLIIPMTADLLLLGLLQVRELRTRHGARRRARVRRRRDGSAPRHHPADRHLVLHLPHHQLHRRQLPRRHQADPEFLRVRGVRIAVLAVGRRPDRAVPADRAGPRDIWVTPTARAGCSRGISFFVVGLIEKVVMADSLAAFVDPALAELPGAVDGRSLARGAGLHVPALLRLLRLQHDGRRARLHVRAPHPAELQLAVQGPRPGRLLAALAHLALDLPARLPVHPVRRQSWRAPPRPIAT